MYIFLFWFMLMYILFFLFVQFLKHLRSKMNPNILRTLERLKGELVFVLLILPLCLGWLGSNANCGVMMSLFMVRM